MTQVRFTGRLTSGHFAETGDGGENAVLQITFPIATHGQRDEISSLMSQAGPWRVILQRKADFEEEMAIGNVVGFTDEDFTFLVPVDRAGQGGFPKGAYVVTSGGIVGVVVAFKAEATEIGRKLVETATALPERILVEQQAVEYRARVIGGMVTTPTGMQYYYRPPVYPPALFDPVHAGVQRPFFSIGQNNLQATFLIARMAHIASDRRLDPYLVAAMLLNAAQMAQHTPSEYVEAVLSVLDDTDRMVAIGQAIQTMPDVQKARD